VALRCGISRKVSLGVVCHESQFHTGAGGGSRRQARHAAHIGQAGFSKPIWRTTAPAAILEDLWMKHLKDRLAGAELDRPSPCMRRIVRKLRVARPAVARRRLNADGVRRVRDRVMRDRRRMSRDHDTCARCDNHLL
jgi:hypothetical protein